MPAFMENEKFFGYIKTKDEAIEYAGSVAKENNASLLTSESAWLWQEQ